MSSAVPQLPLGVQLHESVSFDTFCTGPNTEAVAALRRLPHTGGTLYLHGGSTVGKTHLLHALVRAAGSAGLRASYLDVQQHRHESAAMLDGLEHQDVVALDNLEGAFLQTDWTLGVLRLLDALRAQGKALVLSAQRPPSRVDCVLPDLATRLSACTVFGLRHPTDADRREWLRERAAARGLDMSEDIAQLIVTRVSRDNPTLLASIETLDRAALAAQRKLTLPFVRASLGL